MEIREYCLDDVAEIELVYQQAFRGFPWFESLSREEIKNRWIVQSSKSGFRCLVAEIDGQVVGATWWNDITIDQLKEERGIPLSNFVKRFNDFKLIWFRETCVSPEFQNLGVGTLLKQEIFINFNDIERSTFFLTRMREDNIYIIAISKKLGFKPTGIKVPSSQVVGIFHQYWYKEIKYNLED